VSSTCGEERSCNRGSVGGSSTWAREDLPAAEPLASDNSGVPPQADTPPSAPLQDPAAAHAEWIEQLLESVRDVRTGANKSPATALTQSLWSAIEGNAVPAHIAGRRLRSVFTTDAHGYNPDAMHRHCDAQRERLKDGQDGFCVLLVRTGDLVVGAVLNVLPEWHTKGRRTYIGGPATTVFVCGADGSGFNMYRAADEGNGRFFRADSNALMVGAGSDGAAIRVDGGLTEVQCSPCGSTFAGLESASLLDGALAAGAAGLTKDVGGVRGKVSSLELLLVTEAII